jgi:hypothetical protein
MVGGTAAKSRAKAAAAARLFSAPTISVTPGTFGGTIPGVAVILGFSRFLDVRRRGKRAWKRRSDAVIHIVRCSTKCSSGHSDNIEFFSDSPLTLERACPVFSVLAGRKSSGQEMGVGLGRSPARPAFKRVLPLQERPDRPLDVFRLLDDLQSILDGFCATVCRIEVNNGLRC